MAGLGIFLGTIGALAGLGALEGLGHRRNLAKIRLRIHVNGTRGKSSVTRLVAAGLRAGGIRTSAKTTGTLARMILPDGREYPVFRPSRPNVIEQIRIVRAAAEVETEALVIECMAVQPYLQALSEQRLVRATHAVITNARPDHLEAMGPTDRDVALALAAVTPPKGTVFTGERKHLDVFEMAAKDRGAALVAVDEAEVRAIGATDLAGFSYVEHAENVALALRVTTSLGVARDVALRGMWAARPDPGVLTCHELDFFGRRIYFVNAFAANDRESTGRIWRRVTERFPDVETKIGVVNCRADRPERSQDLAAACPSWGDADAYVLTGTGTYVFAQAAAEAGVDPAKMVHAEDRRVEEIFEILTELAGRSALIIGIANIGGPGLDLVRFFKNRSIGQVREL